MSAPHFRTCAAAAEVFDRLAEKSVAAAARSVVHQGFEVRTEDIETPYLDTLEQTEKASRIDYQLRHAAEIAIERQALQIIGGQDNMRRALAAAADERKATERAEWIEQRAVAIEAAYFADLRAGFRAQAEREAVELSDGAAAATQPATQPEPPPRKPRQKPNL